jgi:hypothetical protein
MLARVKEPSRAGFKLFNLGVTGSYYFEQDWFFTAHLRWVTMIVFMPDIECSGSASTGPAARPRPDRRQGVVR